jgi:predicted nucleic acid-binding protein
MTVVSNSSPLIALARIGQFELLRLLYQKLLIPPAVRSEVVRFGEERIGAVELERADWIQTVAVSDRIPSFQAQPKSDRSRE